MAKADKNKSKLSVRKTSSSQTLKKTKKSAQKKPKLSLNDLNRKIVDMLNRHSPLDLTFSKVSRWTQVPRATLYYYYGNSKDQMIVAAVDAVLQKFLLMNDRMKFSDFSDWNEFQEFLLIKVSEMVSLFPWAPELYYRYRTDSGFIGESVRHLENRYLAERTQAWNFFHPSKKLDTSGVRFASIMKLGLLYAFQVDPHIWLGDANGARRQKMIALTTRYIKEILETSWE